MKNILIFICSFYSYTSFAQGGAMQINGTPITRPHVEVALAENDHTISIVKTGAETLRDHFYEDEHNHPSVWQKMWRLLPEASTLEEWTEIPCTDSRAMQVCLLMDLTGSMAQELEALRQFWPKFSHELTQQYILDQAQVNFRDEANREAIKRQGFGQTSDLSAIYLSQARAGGGGEESEHWPEVLAEAIDSLNWSTDAAARFVFFAVDAAPQHEEETATQLRKLLAKARAKSLHIVPVGGLDIDEELEYLLKSIALITNGFYLQMEATEGQTDISAVVEELQWRAAPICEKQDTKLSLNCFPNPAREYTYIALPIEQGNLLVTDASGKRIHQQAFSQGGQLKLDISTWPTNTYHIEIRQGDQLFVGRFIRQ